MILDISKFKYAIVIIGRDWVVREIKDVKEQNSENVIALFARKIDAIAYIILSLNVEGDLKWQLLS